MRLDPQSLSQQTRKAYAYPRAVACLKLPEILHSAVLSKKIMNFQKKIEDVQRAFTKRTPVLYHEEYHDTLKYLNLYSLVRRRSVYHHIKNTTCATAPHRRHTRYDNNGIRCVMKPMVRSAPAPLKRILEEFITIIRCKLFNAIPK